MGFANPELESIYGVHSYVNCKNKANKSGLLDCLSLAKNPNSETDL